MSDHGLVKDEIRKIVWPILMNINALYGDAKSQCHPAKFYEKF
jgi:hypothetical protein